MLAVLFLRPSMMIYRMIAGFVGITKIEFVETRLQILDLAQGGVDSKILRNTRRLMLNAASVCGLPGYYLSRLILGNRLRGHFSPAAFPSIPDTRSPVPELF